MCVPGVPETQNVQAELSAFHFLPLNYLLSQVLTLQEKGHHSRAAHARNLGATVNSLRRPTLHVNSSLSPRHPSNLYPVLHLSCHCPPCFVHGHRVAC